jgi:hypothetical protein
LKPKIETLIFVGRICDGLSKFSGLILPGQRDIAVTIQDWPTVLAPGSLINVQVEPDGFPARFVKEFGDTSNTHFDSRKFKPEAELEYSVIRHNLLTPTPQQPDRGNLQIWRTYLTKIETGNGIQCWVLRRVHSTINQDVLECVSGNHLRTELSLNSNDRVMLEIEGQWQ